MRLQWVCQCFNRNPRWGRCLACFHQGKTLFGGFWIRFLVGLGAASAGFPALRFHLRREPAHPGSRPLGACQKRSRSAGPAHRRLAYPLCASWQIADEGVRDVRLGDQQLSTRAGHDVAAQHREGASHRAW